MSNHEYSANNVKSVFLEKVLNKSIAYSMQSLKKSMIGFNKNFDRDPDFAIAAVLNNHFGLVESYQALNDSPSVQRHFKQAWTFLNNILAREQLTVVQYEAITRGAKRLNAEWVVTMAPMAQHSTSLPSLNLIPKNRVLH